MNTPPTSEQVIDETSPLLHEDATSESYKGVTMLEAFLYCLPFTLPTTALGVVEGVVIIITSLGSRASSFAFGYFVKVTLDGLTSATGEPFSFQHSLRNAVLYLLATVVSTVLTQANGLLEAHYSMSINRRFDTHCFSRLIHHPFFSEPLAELAEHNHAEEQKEKEKNKNTSSRKNTCDDPDSDSDCNDDSGDIKQYSSGEILSIFQIGRGSLTSLMSTVQFSIIPTFFEILFVLYIFFQLGSSLIAIVTVVTVVLYSITEGFIIDRQKKLVSTLFNKLVGMRNHLNERMTGAGSVCAHATTGVETLRRDELLSEQNRSRMINRKFSYVTDIITSIILDTGTATCLLVAGYEASRGRLTVGNFTLVVTYTSALFSPMIQLSYLWGSIVMDVTRIKKLVDIVTLIDHPAQGFEQFDNDYPTNLTKGRIMVWRDNGRKDEGGTQYNGDENIGHLQANQHQSTTIAPATNEDHNPVHVGVEFRNVCFSYDRVKKKMQMILKGGDRDENHHEITGNHIENNLVDNVDNNSVAIDISTPNVSSSDNDRKKNGKKKKENKRKDSINNEGKDTENFFEGIRDLSFSCTPCRPVAFVGMSGSGKSTVLSIIAGLCPVHSGDVYINGRLTSSFISTYERLQRNKDIASVLQDSSIFSGTIRENVDYIRGTTTKNNGNNGDDDNERVWYALRCVGLDEKVRSMDKKLDAAVCENGKRLSGGERQRLAISRVFAGECSIVLTDEATAALSALDELKVMDSLKELSKRAAVIMVAHRLKTIAFASEIIVLQQGAVEERGTHEELIEKDGMYAKMWREQMDMGVNKDEEE